jgi:hypothetical protein
VGDLGAGLNAALVILGDKPDLYKAMAAAGGDVSCDAAIGATGRGEAAARGAPVGQLPEGEPLSGGAHEQHGRGGRDENRGHISCQPPEVCMAATRHHAHR